jgi:hypothetical protein
MSAEKTDVSRIDVDRFWREGFLVLRDYLPIEYFTGLREQVLESLRRNEREGKAMVDSLADPLLAHYIYDDRILDIARRLLGQREIAYYGDASYAVVGHDYEPGVHVGGWHRDNTDRSNTALPDWKGRYSLIRFGFYLQNHRRTSGGLIVRRTSHDRILRGWRAHLSDRYLNTGPGDVAVWSMRIQHAGLGRCIRGMPWLPLGPYWQQRLPRSLQAPYGKEERAGFWVSYAIEDDHLRRHCDYLLGRSERLKMWKDSHYSPETREGCARAGLKIIDMPSRMRELIAENVQVGQHARHYQVGAAANP